MFLEDLTPEQTDEVMDIVYGPLDVRTAADEVARIAGVPAPEVRNMIAVTRRRQAERDAAAAVK